MRKLNRNDILLITVITAAALLIAVLLLMSGRKGTCAEIYVDGILKAEYILTDDREVEIKGYNGGSNILIIKDGAAYMREASCPDKLCIHQGKISRSGQAIVCLPNRVVIKINDSEGGDYDAITR
ncbi:MAG: NusG domain II-containing protein [Lachnospiraceae bacterium]|nr:NusG domain II-containing protein [Lachnospiraceae bacterium]